MSVLCWLLLPETVKIFRADIPADEVITLMPEVPRPGARIAISDVDFIAGQAYWFQLSMKDIPARIAIDNAAWNEISLQVHAVWIARLRLHPVRKTSTLAIDASATAQTGETPPEPAKPPATL
jgi:hypothetical protein